MGDPTYIWFNSFIRAGRSGYIIKKCTQGTKTANEIFCEARNAIAMFKEMVVSKVASHV